MRLFFLLFTIASTALAGTGVIAVLSAGYVGLTPILVGAGIGVLISMPVSWFVSQKIAELG